ncbi:MAG TPA: trypsin-like peptidase domain-containing protein, partial [Stellaceae bacterium]|nr:trypsin-like peptidase domain-containing protein [Stellaceae bacterium]
MSDLLSARLFRTRGTAGARTALLAAGLGVSLALAPYAQAQDAAAGSNLVQMPSLAPLTKKVLPAVVNVSVIEKASADDQSDDEDAAPGMPNLPQGTPFDDFLRKFFEQQGINPGRPEQHQHAQQMALGSGFIIDPSGYVVTNNHVVDGSEKVTVILQDDSKHVAKIVGRDPKTDLALLKIDNGGKPLPSVAFGDSSTEQVGDWVVAVGNPFGLGGTVSAGIVSAQGRDIHAGPYDNFLQIDAPINRGNSGGPTFNLKGEVIGINTAIYSPNGGSVGIGFAIPSNLAKPVIDQLREHGKVSRGWLG